MNKKFSTLLAGILLAGSFSSTYAQLDNARKVELEKFKEGRAYYLAGTHEDSGNSYFQAFALANPVNAATITETAPTTEAQWFVVKNAQGQYSFMDKDGKFLAFVEKDGAYIVVDKKDDANKETALRWFGLTAKKQLQLMNVTGAPLYLGFKNVNNQWPIALVSKNEATKTAVKDAVALYEAYDTPITPANFRDIEGDNFSFDFTEYAELQGDSTFNDNEITVVTLGAETANNSFLLMVEGEDTNGTFTKGDDKFKAAKFIYLTKNNLTNNVNDETLTGYRYDVISGAELIKGDNKIDFDNAKFYAYTSLNQDGYILKQKDVLGKTGTVWVDKVDAANEVSYVATREVKIGQSPMVIEVGHGTRVAASSIANAKTLVVNVVAANANGAFAKALGLEDASIKMYDKGSAAMKNYPAGQWLVAAGTEANTVKLINVQNFETIDNIAFYATDKAGIYKVKANGTALDGETIKLEVAQSYSQENGYFHAENVEGQTYTLATMVETLVGGQYVDVYLKAAAANKVVFGTPFEERATEWTLTRSDKATDHKATYKYYEGTSLKESKDEVIRKDYTYTIADDDQFIAGAFNLADVPLSFYLRQVAKDAYVIAYTTTTDGDFSVYAQLVPTTSVENDYKLDQKNTLAAATSFNISVVQPFASYPADSKWVNVCDVLGKFVSASETDAAILAKEPMKLFVDSVNAKDATPKFFISQNGKMMVAGSYVADLAETAYENDEITAAERAALIANTWYDYPANAIRRVMFTEAVRVENQDSVLLAGAEEAIETPAEFKFQILEVDGAYILYNMAGDYVNVLNGNLVLGEFNAVETFVIEDTEAPTANEGIATSEVKVIAGEGNVTIAGAAGKKVVISNILGQVVANTVVSSDNAVIAAPAGVVVVAVEGEAAVKAIVK